MTTMNCFIDIETRSGRKLQTTSLRAYADDPSTKVLCVGYALGDQPGKIWIPDKDPAPGDLTAAWHDPACDVVGHNIVFDVTVIERALGFPPSRSSASSTLWHGRVRVPYPQGWTY